ncbi:MAG: zinc ribbon domain-containing protein [Methanomassiliicoccales archaeon]|nr:zinc ribbon domain-containing protein [Methanomassiliicoccales archaeon]
MRANILKAAMCLAFAASLIVISAMPAEAAWGPTVNSGMKGIPAGDYFVVKDFIARAEASVNYDVQVMNTPGPTVDILLMDKDNFELYKSGATFFSYPSISRLDVEYAFEDTGVGGVIDGVEYFLVIDNTNRPAGGGAGNSDAQVMYFFTGTNIQGVTDWDVILIILVIVAVIAIVIVTLALFLLRGSRGKGQIGRQSTIGEPIQGQSMKTCPRCGEGAPAGFAYCPRCGFRY